MSMVLESRTRKQYERAFDDLHLEESQLSFMQNIGKGNRRKRSQIGMYVQVNGSFEEFSSPTFLGKFEIKEESDRT